MIHFSRSLKLCQWSVIPFVAGGLLSAGLWPMMVLRANAQATDFDYDVCAAEMLSLGVEPDAAAIACATSYRPTDISACVAGVLSVADLAPEVAVAACSRDRRPREVSTCVINIHTNLVVEDSLTVLDRCYRTILPERYAACVVGIAAEIGYSTEDSMASCIAAGYRPLNVAPTYIPLD